MTKTIEISLKNGEILTLSKLESIFNLLETDTIIITTEFIDPDVIPPHKPGIVIVSGE